MNSELEIHPAWHLWLIAAGLAALWPDHAVLAAVWVVGLTGVVWAIMAGRTS